MTKHSKLPIIFIVFFLALGIGLMSYPFVSDYVNRMHSSRIMRTYHDAVQQIVPEDFSAYIEAAEKYNASLYGQKNRFMPDNASHQAYLSTLALPDTDIMAYIEIPSIEVKIPIYHGTDDGVLQQAVGHIEGSSLPIGGLGTHACLSGHRGLPSAKLFTDLDKLKNGDMFYIYILDRVLAYQIDAVNIVLPSELELLELDPEHDYCTLITCTPYGVNSHRILVRGTRVEMPEDDEQAVPVPEQPDVPADAKDMTPFVAMGAFIIILLAFIFLRPKKKGRREL